MRNIERNVVYGMYSGLALLMDVCHLTGCKFSSEHTLLAWLSWRPEQRTRVVPSDKCAASWGSEDAEMRMITARFVRVLLKYTDSLCTHYRFTLQQVMPLSKPCNRL